ncbi:MAG: DUF2247 family protein [Firmicutes bacterium]|nr:DUF2247 family protein [Bacillota bacterium]
MELLIKEDNVINKLIKEGKKVTNAITHELAQNCKCPANTLSIQVPYMHAAELVNLNWNDILFAIENNYFHYSVAVDYAATLISENSKDDDPIFKLSCFFPSEIVKQEILDQFVVELAQGVSKKNKDETKNKVMYITLSWLFENKCFFQDIIGVVEMIYCDFDHPEIISNLIRYMPDETNYSQIFNTYEEKFLYNWQKYLQDQKLKFAKT